MHKQRKRIWVRVAPDNPIFQVPAKNRSQVAEDWLRLGADADRLTNLLNRLENIISRAASPIPPMAPQGRDKKIEEMDRKLIHDILNLGGKK